MSAMPESRRRVLRTLAASGAAAMFGARVSGVGASVGSEGQPDRSLSRFSAARPGAFPPGGWREKALRDIAPNRHTLVDDGGVTVLRVDSAASASSLVHSTDGAANRATRLRWRWKTSAYPSNDGFGEKRGDDYAARIYLMFDYPLQRVPFGQRMLLGLARAAYDDDIPAATLCYLLDSRAPAETMIESPYTSRVRMIVVRSSPQTGRWWDEERDIGRDFARAFGGEYGPGIAPLRAIAVAADSDQSGARLSTWFGDLELDRG